MNRNLHKACIWSAAMMVGLFTVSVLLAHLFPPPSPTQHASTVASFYRNHEIQVRVGLIIGMFAAAFMGPFTAAIAWEVQRITGGRRSVAANLQLIFGLMFLASLFFPYLVFMGASFRPDRPVDITQALYDTAWIMFVAPVSVGVLELLFLGYAMLSDKRAIPTFPRWFGYYTLFVGFDFAGGGFCVLTKTGPFAWNGVISYYIPFATWGMWVTGMILYMTRAADREWDAEREGALETNLDSVDDRLDLLTADVAKIKSELYGIFTSNEKVAVEPVHSS